MAKNKMITIGKAETWTECSFCGEENKITDKEKDEFQKHYEFGADFKLLKECLWCKESYLIEYIGDGLNFDDVGSYYSDDASDYDCF